VMAYYVYSLCISDNSPLLDTYFANVFFQSVVYFFIVLTARTLILKFDPSFSGDSDNLSAVWSWANYLMFWNFRMLLFKNRKNNAYCIGLKC